MENLTPIVLFVYNRPLHTRKTIEALSKNKLADQSQLFVFSDGPKEDASIEDVEKINEIRELINEITGFKSIEVIESEFNLGLAKSIIQGVNFLFEKHDKLIVLEDDIVPSIGFLKYMNSALNLYENNEKVGCIHAWNYNLKYGKNYDSTFFLKGADCWGWATWKSSWKLFNPNGDQLLKQIEETNQHYSFNRNGSHDFIKMLKDQINGDNNSWAIRWHASLFLAGKFCLHPTIPIVQNIGIDNSGTHSFNPNIEQHPIKFIDLKEIAVEESNWFFSAFDEYSKKIVVQKKKRINKLKIQVTNRIKLLLPPIFLIIILKLRNRKEEPVMNEIWTGSYSSWKEAKELTDGYDSSIILNKCMQSLLKVKTGEEIYERDSVLFNEIQYSWGLLSALQKAANENDGHLNIVDFGGSLGSTFYQNKSFLDGLKSIRWSVVEQEHFVKCGKENFEDDNLKFYYSIEECLEIEKPTIIILSSVLQYLEFPYDWLLKIMKLNFQYIVLDRTSFIESKDDIITLQQVPESIYKASYPSWFFNEKKMEQSLSQYNLLATFNNYFTPDTKVNNLQAYWRGKIFKKNEIS
jgi:putative methyltransferase (TIGR04325 family)